MSIEKTYFLSLHDILDIHSEVVGNPCTKTKFLNKNSLLSVVGQVPQNVFGQDCYPGLWNKAAAYMCLMTWNHPFHDGNKRTAFLSGMIFLEKNNVEIEFQQSKGMILMLEITNKKPKIKDVANTLEEHAHVPTRRSLFRP
ncbi:MAG: type II toxin-antitoxin system death-on-curing family toxin [Chlamydiia bacterium]|nr:type II toxin-antitoxin system death-on-curing family toxin [Chlamydiia bacterium]